MERDYYSVATVYPINYRQPLHASVNTHLYLSRDGGHFLYNDGSAIYHMVLSVPFDFSTMSFVVALDTYEYSMMRNLAHQWMSPDGMRLFGAYLYGDDAIAQYDLTTAWDLSSIQLGSKATFFLGITYPSCMFMTNDGQSVYVLYGNGYSINHYSLSTPFNVASAVLEYSIGLSNTDWMDYDDGDMSLYMAAGGFTISDDGTRVFLCSTQGAIVEVRLATPWDLRTRERSDWPVFPFNQYDNVLDGFPRIYADSMSIGGVLGELFFCGFNYDLGKGSVVKFTGTPLPGPSPSQFWTNFAGQTEIA